MRHRYGFYCTPCPNTSTEPLSNGGTNRNNKQTRHPIDAVRACIWLLQPTLNGIPGKHDLAITTHLVKLAPTCAGVGAVPAPLIRARVLLRDAPPGGDAIRRLGGPAREAQKAGSGCWNPALHALECVMLHFTCNLPVIYMWLCVLLSRQ